MKILVSAFEPFGGRDTNSSLETLNSLPDTISDTKVCKIILPVVFDECFEVLKAEAERIKPDAIICLGQAEGRSAITPEFIGINVDYAYMADNSGNSRILRPIIPSAPDAYKSTLPIEDMINRMKAANVPASVSFTAGTYVCNNLMFHTLHYAASEHIRAGFIHLPLSSTTGETRCPVMSPEALRTGVAECISATADSLR